MLAYLWLGIGFIALVGIVIVLIKRMAWWKKFFLSLVLLAGLVFALGKFLFPFIPAFEPTGPFPVKTSWVYLKHSTQYPNFATNADNEREIPILVWQPDQKDLKNLPLIIFSHGSFGTPQSNESTFLELASRGYVVASLAHPHHSFKAELSSGESIDVDWSFVQEVMSAQGSEDLSATLNDLQKWTAIRNEDLYYVLDQVLAKDTQMPFSELINPKQIFLAGHSLGAGAALAVGRQRSEDLRGIISLEAPFIGDLTGVEGDHFTWIEKEYPLPILHFYSDALWGKMSDIPTYQRNQELIDKESNKFVNIHIAGSGHLGLTDLELVTPIITNLMDGGMDKKSVKKKVDQINQEMLEFLEQNLDE